jgi:K+/H+ antiporter YhaU regulatory subunit KhtT
MLRSMTTSGNGNRIDIPHMEIAVLTVEQDNNSIVGKKLSVSNIRKIFSVNLVAIKREDGNYASTGGTRLSMCLRAEIAN